MQGLSSDFHIATFIYSSWPLITHLAEEMTTECWSEVKILDKWAATESS